MISLLFPLYCKLHYVVTQTKYRLASSEQFQSAFKEVYLISHSGIFSVKNRRLGCALPTMRLHLCWYKNNILFFSSSYATCQASFHTGAWKEKLCLCWIRTHLSFPRLQLPPRMKATGRGIVLKRQGTVAGLAFGCIHGASGSQPEWSYIPSKPNPYPQAFGSVWGHR